MNERSLCYQTKPVNSRKRNEFDFGFEFTGKPHLELRIHLFVQIVKRDGGIAFLAAAILCDKEVEEPGLLCYSTDIIRTGRCRVQKEDDTFLVRFGQEGSGGLGK